MIDIFSIKVLIDTWPTRKDFAADIGVSLDRVHKWTQTGAIPARFWARLLKAAVIRGIVVTPDDLVRLHDLPEAEEAA